jgi:hypothetical protein
MGARRALEERILKVASATELKSQNRLRRYPEYQASNIGWLDEIPKNWQTKRLRYLIRINPSKSEVRGLNVSLPVSSVPMESISELGELQLDEVKPLGSTIGDGRMAGVGGKDPGTGRCSGSRSINVPRASRSIEAVAIATG